MPLGADEAAFSRAVRPGVAGHHREGVAEGLADAGKHRAEAGRLGVLVCDELDVEARPRRRRGQHGPQRAEHAELHSLGVAGGLLRAREVKRRARPTALAVERDDALRSKRSFLTEPSFSHSSTCVCTVSRKPSGACSLTSRYIAVSDGRRVSPSARRPAAPRSSPTSSAPRNVLRPSAKPGDRHAQQAEVRVHDAARISRVVQVHVPRHVEREIARRRCASVIVMIDSFVAVAVMRDRQ